MNTQTYTVNIRTGVVNITRVDVSQGDTGRTLAFSLYDGLSPFTPPTGSTVTIVGRKPSKLGFTETCTVSGNVATVATTLAMTQEAGKFPAELRIEAGGQSIGTANFTMYIEPSPHPDGTTDGTHATVDNLQTQIGDLANLTTTAKTNLVSAINEAAQSGGTEVVIDNTLTQTGQAADAKKTGDEISAIKADLEDLDERVEALESGSGGSGLTEGVKAALLQLAQKVAYIDDGGQNYYDDLYDALYAITAITLNTNSIFMQTIGATSQLTATTTPAGGSVTWSSSNTSVATVSSTGLVTSVAYGSATITATSGNVSATCGVTVAQATLTSISAAYTQSGTVYDTDPLDSLKDDLVVTATWSNQTTSVVPSADYTLSGTLAEGTSTITVAYGDKTTTFNVTTASLTLTSITASYTQSGTVYSDDSLDNLKSDLVVTAHYDNGTSQVLTDSAYTLTGNFNSATSTITVSYDGKTATFTVTVTAVGSVEYADDLSNWFLSATASSTSTVAYSDGKITLKGSQTDANNYRLFTFDRAKTLWDTVKNKKLRIRVTLDSPDWVGDISESTPLNRVVVGVAIYNNAQVNAGNLRQKYTSLDVNILPASTPTTYEYIFDADVSNFNSGTGTPTNVSTFGLFVYNASTNTIEITDGSIVEVLTS